MFDDWAEDLAPYSEAHVAEVCREWRKTKTYFPKIAEFVSLLDAKLTLETQLRHRARVLLQLDEPRPWERTLPAPDEGTPITPERMAEIMRAIGAGPMAKAALDTAKGEGGEG
jgi:hypothetical protein